jgi:hypothetical protein
MLALLPTLFAAPIALLVDEQNLKIGDILLL